MKTQQTDAELISRSVRVPEDFSVVFERHADQVHCYLARPDGTVDVRIHEFLDAKKLQADLREAGIREAGINAAVDYLPAGQSCKGPRGRTVDVKAAMSVHSSSATGAPRSRSPGPRWGHGRPWCWRPPSTRTTRPRPAASPSPSSRAR